MPETIKLLEENIEHSDTSHRKIFDLPPRVMKIKTKLNKWIMIKLKCVCTAKEIIKKMKDNPQIGGK